MSFTPNIPASGESLGASRLEILNNFTNYNTVVGIDHIAPYPANTDQGEHKKITLNTFGSASYTPSGSKSFISSFSASSAGSQLVYQPSVVNFFVPISPRSIARVIKTVPGNPGTYILGNGPYGGLNFNASTPTGVSAGVFTYNFANALTTDDYFVVVTAENTGFQIGNVSNKTTSGFRISTTNVNFTGSITVMVF